MGCDGEVGQLKSPLPRERERVAASSHPWPDMYPHRLEIPIVVEQFVSVFDAAGANEQVRGLADRDAKPTQEPIVPSHLHCQPFAQHGYNGKVPPIPEAGSATLIPGAAQHLQ